MIPYRIRFEAGSKVGVSSMARLLTVGLKAVAVQFETLAPHI